VLVFPNGKINLGLQVTEKRKDGFHNLETIFYPIPFYDGLELIHHPDFDDELNFSQSGIFLDIPTNKNICYKAFQLIKKDFPSLKGVKLHLHKVIPSGAGLGGGSSDAAFLLMLLNTKFNLGLQTSQLQRYALELGSDCPFFLLNQPAIARGRGEILEPIPIDLKGYYLLLINPRIHIPTSWAFSKIIPEQNRPTLKEIPHQAVNLWKDQLKNDFEVPVFEKYPQIKSIKEQLYKSGAVYASLSGSGSTVFGLFKDLPELLPFFPDNYFVKSLRL
jgi:4-diphosphocytidyl-2-C-methyl-D-erythritol kinase